MCPIPGDNGQPKLEREKQNALIKEVAETGANVKSELRFNKPTKTDMGHLRGDYMARRK